MMKCIHYVHVWANIDSEILDCFVYWWGLISYLFISFTYTQPQPAHQQWSQPEQGAEGGDTRALDEDADPYAQY